MPFNTNLIPKKLNTLHCIQTELISYKCFQAHITILFKLVVHPRGRAGVITWQTMKPKPNVTTSKTKRRTSDQANLALVFTSTMLGHEERPQCAVCPIILTSDRVQPNKLGRNLETTHPDHKEEPVDLFRKQTTRWNSILDNEWWKTNGTIRLTILMESFSVLSWNRNTSQKRTCCIHSFIVSLIPHRCLIS